MMIKTGAALAVTTALAISVTGLHPASAVAGTSGEVTRVPTAQVVTTSKPSPKFGLYPQWVQRPYLHKKGKRFVVKASLLADLYRLKSKASTDKDRLSVQIRVAKPAKVKGSVRRDVGLLPANLLAANVTVRIKPLNRQVTDVSVTLSKSLSRKLAKVAAATRRAAVSVTVQHRKDTTKKVETGLVQVLVGPLAKGKYSDKTLAKRERTARLKRKRLHHPNQAPKTAASGSQLGSIGNEPWYNVISVTNNSPFFQQVNVNPNIQCMWTGSTPNANLASSISNVGPWANVQFVFPYTSGSSQQPGLAGATGGLNAPGTQGSMIQDLAQAGVAAGQSALGDLADPKTYSEGGAIAAVGTVALTFAKDILKDVLAGTSTCDDVSTYPELFAVSTTVTGFGTNDAPNAAQGNYPEPVTWSALSGWGTQFSQSPGGTAAPSPAWITANFASMLGAQTNVTYYWNGGQAAPMVSNNASSGSYLGGIASYQGGLFQFVGPNPGTPSSVAYWNKSGPQTSSTNWSSTYEACLFGDNTSDAHFGCTMNDGYVPIQLGMITNPNSQGGLWITGQPNVSVTGDTTNGYTIQCQIPDTMEATFQVPFGQNGNSSALQSSTLATTSLNASGQKPTAANYTVNYFATNSAGQFIYYDSSVETPGANGLYTPYLAPNAGTETVSMALPNIAQGLVGQADLDDLVTWGGPGTTPQPISASDIANVGCNVTASVNLQGLDITNPDSSFGSNWPMPNGMNNGWPAGGVPSSNFDFSWMTPVQQLNMTFQSMPVGNSTSVAGG